MNLDNCHSAQITGLTDDFKSLLSLSLANVGLTSLKGFPNLPNLRKVFIAGRYCHLPFALSLSLSAVHLLYDRSRTLRANSSQFIMLGFCIFE